MSDWVERLQEEKNELALRLMKLEAFTSSPKGKELSLIDILLLKKQAGIMEALLETLEERLAKIKTDEEEDARMKNIVRNGNNGEHYLITEEKERYAGVLNELEKEIKKMSPKVDETEYLTSSKANADKLNAAKKAFEDSIEDYLDRERSDTEITPQALVDLGFKEVYQGINQGDAGYIYYDLEVKGVGFLSTSLGEDEPLHVMLGYEGQHAIHNLAKLKELIRILTLID